jgi:hypothetical protein
MFGRRDVGGVGWPIVPAVIAHTVLRELGHHLVFSVVGNLLSCSLAAPAFVRVATSGIE